MRYHLDPDFRKEPPKDGSYCVRCQRLLENPKEAVKVTVDWNTWLVEEGGSELIGKNCWKIIKGTPNCQK